MNEDVVSNRIMRELAMHLRKVLTLEIYYQKTDLVDELELIHVSKNENNKNRKKTKP